MNKIYKLKFDKRRNELVVVSEITAGMGKEKSTGHISGLPGVSSFWQLLGTITPLALLTGLVISLFPGVTVAADLPSGGQIVGGQGSISASGNQMTIHQQTQNMVTNWHSFDVGKNNTVQFVQPDSSSVALNRVTGASGSQIMGTLKANGQVFILNPNGVLFGKDARVNVAGLVASTKDISTADFMSGHYTLSGSGTRGAQVVNQGSLTTSKGGYIVLAGERVSNSGTVTTPSGKTVLAAGKMVTLQLDNGGLTSVSVNGSVVNALVENRGLISATDGQVYLTAKGQDMLLKTVVNNSGTVEAKGLADRGGEIVLDGGDSGVINQSGQLLADNHNGQGGKITLEGQNIYLAGNSLTSATGKTGGGEVFVGGGWQGKDSRIKNARKVVMDRNATVDVSATESGNGGTAVLWSDDYTNFRGAVLAKGGTRSGNGGRVETSSRNNLQISGVVDAASSAGKGGNWLIDPTDITIMHGSSDSNASGSINGSEDIFTPTAGSSGISDTTITGQLNNGTSVVVKTSGHDEGSQKGNITVSDNVNITKSSGADAGLTLLADNNIQLGSRGDGNGNANIVITSTDGKLDLNLLAGNSTRDGSAKIQVGKGTNISLNGGNFTVAGAEGSNISFTAPHGDNGTITAGNIVITALGNQGINTAGLSLNATSGNLTINASKVTSQSTWNNNVTWSAGKLLSVLSAGNVNIVADDTSHGGGKTLLSGNDGVNINSTSGNVTASINGGNSGVNVSSAAGEVVLNAGGGDLGFAKGNISANTTIKLKAAGTVNATGEKQGGNISLNSGTMAADGDITLEAAGAADLSGVNISSTNGAVSAEAQGGGITLGTGKIAAHGDITLKASAGSVNLGQGSSFISSDGNIALSGNTTGTTSDAVVLAGGSNNKKINVSAVNGTVTLTGNATSGDGVSVINATVNATKAVITGVSESGHGFSLTNTTLQGSLADLSNVTLNSSGSGAGAWNILDSSVVTGTSRDNLLKKTTGSMTTVNMNGTAIFNSTSAAWDRQYQTDDHPYNGWIFSNTTVNAASANLSGVGFINSTLNIATGNLTITGKDTVGVKLNGSTLNVSNGAVNISAAGGQTVLDNASISAKNGIVVSGGEGSISASGNASLNTTTGDITLRGKGTGNVSGIVLNGSGAGKVILNAAAGHLNLNGSAESGTGVSVNNVTLNATGADITGISTSEQGGHGFSLTNTTLQGDLADLSNVTLNSSGSGAGAWNILDSSVVTGTSRDNLLKKSIGSMTTVNMNGTAIFNNSTGIWNQQYQTDNSPGNGWIFSNTSVNAGSVNVSGVGFTNSTVTVSNGDLRITNNGPAILNHSTVTVSNGTVNISSTAGGIDLSGTAVSAGKDITLSAGAGDISMGGNNVSQKDITSTDGCITAVAGGNLSMGYMNITTSGTGHDITLLAGNTTTDGTSLMFMDTKTNITAGGDFTAGAGAGNSGGISFSAPHADGNTITANNIDITVTGNQGMSTAGLNLNATTGNLTINAGSVSSASTWGHNVSWTAGKQLSVTSDGNIGLLANDNYSNQGVANTLLSGVNGVTITSGNGSITLDGTGNKGSNNRSNVTVTSAGGDISLQATNGTVQLSGSVVDGNQTVAVTADKGNITISGNGGSNVGVNFQNTNLSAANMTVTGNTTGWAWNLYSVFGGVRIFGNVAFHVKDGGKGVITGISHTDQARPYTAGVAVGNVYNSGTNVLFDGDFDIKGEATGTLAINTVAGIYFEDQSLNMTFTGNTILSADGYDGASGVGSTYTAYQPSAYNHFNLQNNATLTINASSDSGAALFLTDSTEYSYLSHGFRFSGYGNVNINGHSNSSVAFEVNNFDNTSLNGSFSVNATNKGGDAVVFPGYTQINLVNATINGTSESGAGIRITTNQHNGVNVNLGNNTLNGVSHSGDGVNINGLNVTISNGTLNGTSTSGDGNGVVLTGNTNYTIDGASISGQSANGSGVVVSGNLAVNNGTVLSGNSTGSGSGVMVNGTLISEGGVSISGNATTGSGVLVNGDTQLNNATVSGNTASGSGVNITGNLTNNDTTISGNATGQGSGVEIGGNITGGSISGNSATGNGVLVSGGESTVTDTTISGTTDTGKGVNISGNLINAGSTTIDGRASGGGAGVELGGNVSGGTVNGTADHGTGVIITGENSTATDTVIQGNTVNGSGVNVSGNAALNNATLNGSSVDGTGTVINGTITADTTSRVNGS
ncbi:filamentous hemagglutinin N-terminal domain-containing protein, partial [Salmonella enterica]|nr:filamentous hemagglutinin N-terminal domain-containing protein [Salmonella enterica]